MSEALPPLIVEFEVQAGPEEAFALWTTGTRHWWPGGHTMTRNPADIVFEPRAGGRMFELGRDGVEQPWGEIIDWEPPHRLRYWWHLFFPREQATVVEVTFVPLTQGTRVRLVQTGWGSLGEEGPPRRERTQSAWHAVIEPYRATANIG